MKTDKRLLLLSIALSVIVVVMMVYYLTLVNAGPVSDDISVSDLDLQSTNLQVSDDTTVTLSSTDAFEVGATGRVGILLSAGDSIDALSVYISYDPAVFDASNLVLNGTDFDIVARNDLDTETGTIQFDMATTHLEGIAESQLLGYFDLTRKIARSSDVVVRSFDPDSSLDTLFTSYVNAQGQVYSIPESSWQID